METKRWKLRLSDGPASRLVYIQARFCMNKNKSKHMSHMMDCSIQSSDLGNALNLEHVSFRSRAVPFHASLGSSPIREEGPYQPPARCLVGAIASANRGLILHGNTAFRGGEGLNPTATPPGHSRERSQCSERGSGKSVPFGAKRERGAAERGRDDEVHSHNRSLASLAGGQDRKCTARSHPRKCACVYLIRCVCETARPLQPKPAWALFIATKISPLWRAN